MLPKGNKPNPLEASPRQLWTTILDPEGDQFAGYVIPEKETLRLIPFLVFPLAKISLALWPKDEKQDHLSELTLQNKANST